MRTFRLNLTNPCRLKGFAASFRKIRPSANRRSRSTKSWI